MTASAAPVLLAHHQLVQAVPFFVPVLVAVLTFAVIVVTDRRRAAHPPERDSDEPAGEDGGRPQGAA